MSRIVAALVTVVFAVFVASGCFELNRAETLTPGTVRGVALVGDDVVAGARAVLGNGQRFARSDARGAFVVGDLSAGFFGLRVFVDGDGDGVAERGAVRGFSVAGDDGVDLGPVQLEGVVAVSGNVVDELGGVVDNARVVVVRASIDTSAEQLVAVDAAGAFAFRVVPGAVQVVAFDDDGRASEVRSLVLDPVDPTVPFTLTVRAAAVVEVTTRLTPAEDGVGFTVVPVGAVAPAAATAGAGEFTSIPVGVHDVFVYVDDVVVGLLEQQVALPSIARQQLGPALRRACPEGRCPSEGEGEGEGEGENDPPSLDVTQTVVVVPLDQTAPRRIAYAVTDTDNADDEVIASLRCEQGVAGLVITHNEREHVIEVSLEALQATPFVRHRCDVCLRNIDQAEVCFGDAFEFVIADGVFVGTGGAGLVTDDITHWADGVVPDLTAPTNKAIVIEAGAAATLPTNLTLQQVDVRGVLSIAAGATLTTAAVYSTGRTAAGFAPTIFGGALQLGGGASVLQANLDGTTLTLLTGHVVDVGHFDSGVVFGGGATIDVQFGAVLRFVDTGETNTLFLSSLVGDGLVEVATPLVIDGNIDLTGQTNFGAEGRLQFVGGGIDRTVRFAGTPPGLAFIPDVVTSYTFSSGTNISATRLEIGSNAIVDVGAATIAGDNVSCAGAVVGVLRVGSAVSGDFDQLTIAATGDSGTSLGGDVTAVRVTVLPGARLALGGTAFNMQVNDDVSVEGEVTFGTGALLKTNSLTVAGGGVMRLLSGGRLEVVTLSVEAAGEISRLGTATPTHTIVFPAGPTARFETASASGFDILENNAELLTVSGSVSGFKLVNTGSFQGTLTATECQANCLPSGA